MSDDIPGLVETSTNLARVRTRGDGVLRISMSNRSSVDSALRAQQARIAGFAALAGGEAAQSEGYPGWKPNLDSPVLATMKRVHARVAGVEPAGEGDPRRARVRRAGRAAAGHAT